MTELLDVPPEFLSRRTTGSGWIVEPPGVPWCWFGKNEDLWARWRRLPGWSGFVGVIGRFARD